MGPLLTIDEALAAIFERVTPVAAERVEVEQADGRVLAEDARATVDLPPFPSSAMDGFAVRAADTPGTLPVVEQIPAGRPAPRALAPGEAMAISTGGVVPDGADAVIPVEYVVQYDNDVEISGAAAVGIHVRPRGGDVAAGELVLAAGTRLGPAQVGALAAAGIAEAVVARRPRVAIVSTGSELQRPGEPLRPGQIYDANAVMLAAALRSTGADVVTLTAVADDEPAQRATLERGLEADVLVSSGGVSVGPHDLVRRIEAELGVEEVFWRVAVKPGKPLAFGVRDGTLVFGLPGNPVSALVCCELFVRPALLALQGAAEPGPAFSVAALTGAVRRNADRDELVRACARVEAGRVLVAPLRGQESHMIARSAAADALVFVPRGDGELAAGESVRYLPLR
ncbi:MAG: molybdopterin molybdotransferase MoeA [Gaiellaceae bacterium]